MGTPSLFNMVGEFHRKFGLRVTPAQCCASWDRDPPSLPDPETFMFRLQFLLEELGETLAAYRKGDLSKVADGLVDLIYVALGTAHMCGIPFDEIFDAVHEANMKKVRARTDAESGRGSSLDVVKPPGWTPPDVEGILQKYAEKQRGGSDAVFS